MLLALLEYHAKKISKMEGRGKHMIIAAVITFHCRVLRSAALQFPYWSAYSHGGLAW